MSETTISAKSFPGPVRGGWGSAFCLASAFIALLPVAVLGQVAPATYLQTTQTFPTWTSNCQPALVTCDDPGVICDPVNLVGSDPAVGGFCNQIQANSRALVTAGDEFFRFREGDPDLTSEEGAFLAFVASIGGTIPADAQATFSQVGYFPILGGPWYLSYPQQVAFDSGGNMYVSNAVSRGIVLKLSPGGHFLRSWSGRPSPSTAALIPAGVSVGPDGTLYVVNRQAFEIEKFNAAGLFVGSIRIGLEFGNNEWPDYLAVDGSSRLYITNNGQFVARYRADGTFVDLIGNAPGDGQLMGARQVALDAVGNIYVADVGEGGRVMKYSPTGQYLGKIGVGRINIPDGVTVDSAGNVYVEAGPISKFDTNGNLLLQWGSFGTEPGQYNSLHSLATGPDGNIYAVDSGIPLDSSGKVLVFSPAGQLVKEYGCQGREAGRFWQPATVAVAPSGQIYVADTGNDRIQKFDRQGKFLMAWGSTGAGNGQFSRPWGISVAENGDVFVADTGNARVQKFDKDGSFLLAWGTKGEGPGQFQAPNGISVNPPGNVVVIDPGRYVQRFDESGVFLNRWISPLGGPSNERVGVATSPSGEVYTINPRTALVEHFSLDGATLGSWGRTGSGPGQFQTPQGICVDRSGFVYVADTSNRRIQKFDGDGAFVESIGPFGAFSEGLSNPTGCAVSPNGDLLIADKLRSRVSIFSRRPGASRLVAAAANSAGQNGTYWRTDVELSNASTSPRAVLAYFWPRGLDNLSAEATTIGLAPGENRFLADVVSTLFGRTEAAGAITFDSDGSAVLATSRTYTLDASAGSYGQGIAAPLRSSTIYPGHSVGLAGLLSGSEFRTNIGVVNISDYPCQSYVDFFDSRGSPLGHATFDLPPRSPAQFSMGSLTAIPPEGGALRAEVHVDGLGCASTAYASVVDNRTGDPVFVPAVVAAGDAPLDGDLIVPVVAHAEGMNGSIWRSDLYIGNDGPSRIQVQVALSQPSGPPVFDPPFWIESGESLEIPDVLLSRFGLDSGIGALRVSSSSYGLLVRSRTYNSASGGTYGQSVSPVEARNLFSSERPATLLGILRNDDFRTNLGIVNTSDSAADFRVALVGSDGAVVSEVIVSVAGPGLSQITDIVGATGLAGDQENLRATVSTEGQAAFAAYVSRVDNRTGDAVFEAAQ